MNTRAERVVAALRDANGRWVDAEALAVKIGSGTRQVPAAISEARQAGHVIETHTIRGVGWRLCQPAAPIEPVAKPSSAGKPLTPTAAKLVAVLESRRGQFVPGRTLTEIMDIDLGRLNNYAREIRARRPDLNLQSRHGKGYGLDVPGAEADLPVTRTERLLALLEASRGSYVPSNVLADAIGGDVAQLGNYIKRLRRTHPDLNLQSRNGKGYGIDVPDNVPEPVGLPPQQVSQPGSKATSESRYRDALDLLAGLSPASAELVRQAALDSGQPGQAALEQLIQYGWEVHRDLIAQGENPLMLRRAA